jgi:hypothetical protein
MSDWREIIGRQITSEQAQKIVRAIHAESPDVAMLLRDWAKRELLKDWPDDQGLGSSDVSCYLINAVMFWELPAVGAVRRAYTTVLEEAHVQV